jgi:hypothetical protein
LCSNDVEIEPPANIPCLVFLAICLICPVLYEGNQASRAGFIDYAKEPWNYVDFFGIIMGYFNLLSQVIFGTWVFTSKLSMIIVILLALMKLFFFLRYFDGLSYIVTMIIGTIRDLRVFLLFFFILIYHFALCFDVNGAT